MISDHSRQEITQTRLIGQLAGCLKTGTIALALVFCFFLSAHAAYEISDKPMTAQVSAGPPLIMFVLDDSGSMDFEIMTPGSGGRYNDFPYLFDDPGTDNEYKDSDHKILEDPYRDKWHSQWYGYNKVYYNYTIDYNPWPKTTTHDLGDADPKNPRVDPIYENPTFDLSGEFITIGTVSVKRSHYYAVDDTNGNGAFDAGETVYLVNIDPSSTPPTRTYYKATLGDNTVDGDVTGLAEDTNPPDSIKAVEYDDKGKAIGHLDAAEDLQNFANWYSYYRRRELAQKASVSAIIDSVKGVKIGFYGLHTKKNDKNYQLRTPVKPVYLNEGGVLENKRDELLDELYQNDSRGGTPLRVALKEVGEYYKDGGNLAGKTPFSTSAKGGDCQLAFAIVVTDGYWNSDSSPGVGNADKDKGSPYEDTYSNTLADVAMAYYDTDLIPDGTLSDKVPPGGCDNNPAQHMVTYTVSFGLQGTLPLVKAGEYDYENDQCLTECTTCPEWPKPEKNTASTIDDLWHAAVNGRGAYYSAANTPELVEAMTSIFNNIDDRTSSGSAVSVDGEEISSGLTLYQATYDTTDWTGDVTAYPIDPDTGEIIRDPAQLKHAAAELTTADGRKIVTYHPTDKDGIPFLYDDLEAGQRAALGADEAEQKKVITYLRGTEVDGFRERKQILGDIIHASPVWVPDDVMDLDGPAGLYVGGNDGMLHVFDAETLKERWAYIPNQVFGNLVELTKPNYSHLFFVDATPSVRSYFTSDLSSVKTLMVGGLGKGGKGYYGLDLSNVDFSSEANAAAAIAWEYPITPGSDDNLGYTYSRPFIVRTNLASPAPEMVIMFGNGYQSANGRAILYVLNLDGTLYKKYDTGVGSPADPNGLSTPCITDVNGDFKADYAYAGDWKGNLWKFDFTSDDVNDWGFAYEDSGNPAPLFVAKDKNGNRQTITVQPDAMFHPDPFKAGYMVIFGTGKFLGGTNASKNDDINDTSLQTVYGIWDYGDDTDDDEYLGAFNRSSANVLSNQTDSVSLVEQTELYWGIPTGYTSEIRLISCNEPDWTTSDDTDFVSPGVPEEDDPAVHAGWYFDLMHHSLSPQVMEGERMVIDPIIRDGFVIFLTYTPEPNLTCASGGFSILHELIAGSGSGCFDGAKFDANGDGKIDDNDLVDGKTPAGVAKEGMLYLPKILPPHGDPPGGGDPSGGGGSGDDDPEDEEEETKLFSSSKGAAIEIVKEKAKRKGISYWQEF